MAKAAVGAARIMMSINSVEFSKQLQRMDKSTKQWQRSLKNVEREFLKTGRSIERTGKSMMKTVTGPVAGLLTGLVALQKRTGDYADELLDLSEITGLSTDALQEWRNVARVAGVDTNAMSNAVSGLTRRIRGISEESGSAYEAAEKLGVSFKNADGSIRDVDEVMAEAIERLSQMDAGLERSALANDLFGRRWEQLGPILGMTSDEIRNARNQAHDLNMVMGREALESANRFRQEMSQLSEQFAATGRQLATDLLPLTRDVFLPLMQDAVTAVQSLTKRFSQMDVEVQKNYLKYIAFAAAIGPVVWGVGKLVTLTGKLIGLFRTLLFVVAPFLIKLGLIAVAIGTLVVVGQNMMDNWEVWKAEFQWIWDTMAHSALRGAVYIAQALNKIGLLSDENFNKLSIKSAEARFEMLNSKRAFDLASEGLVSLEESADNVWQKIKDLASSAKDATLGFLGLRNETRKMDEEFKKLNVAGETIGILDVFKQDIKPPNFDPIIHEFQRVGGAMDGQISKFQQFKIAIRDMGMDFKQFIAGEMTTAVLSFGEALGRSLAGAENQWQTTFEKILLIVVDFAQSLARLAGAIGGVMLFIPGMQGTGAGLLAAAAALTAATTFVRSSIEQRAQKRQDTAQSIPMMAEGGIVPRGFPNDTYPAFLTSGERVIPDPLPLNDSSINANIGGKGFVPIHINIDSREVARVLGDLEYKRGR